MKTETFTKEEVLEKIWNNKEDNIWDKENKLLSERMYQLNRQLSIKYAMKQNLTLISLETLNLTIGEWIKEVRELEKFKEVVHKI